ncbi:hypothetical protein [Halorussus litoreus]|uniref:hypothetical protein n=1 Tax=Halorussus litoreus TaxID=1710536 RepID=UPI000E22B640|nr:hypothetical protein [Halorussus litoreus]
MPQRSDQRSSDSVADEYAHLLDDDLAESESDEASGSPQSAASQSDSSESSTTSASFGQRLQHRAGSLFSPRVFLYAVVLLGGGMFAGNAFIPIPFLDSLAGLVGVFAGAFVLGLAAERSTVLESAAAGAVAAGLTVLLTNLTLSVVSGFGAPMAAFGAGTGLLAGALGAYFGEDLRDGLTADI